MESIKQLLHFVLHIDQSLLAFVTAYGIWTYAVLFLVIFCETGLVVTPFLPGDSLLFAAGSIAAAAHHALDIRLLIFLLIVASILGNTLNYLIGRLIGPRVFSAQQSWLLNKKYLHHAHQFYERHGGKTIIIARFIPIIRTFGPFVAGIGAMNFARFTVYNIGSAVLWVGGLLCLGYFFGQLPFVQMHFTLAIYAIVVISVLPPLCMLGYRKLTYRHLAAK
jgi:membrane-associated protein